MSLAVGQSKQGFLISKTATDFTSSSKTSSMVPTTSTTKIMSTRMINSLDVGRHLPCPDVGRLLDTIPTTAVNYLDKSMLISSIIVFGRPAHYTVPASSSFQHELMDIELHTAHQILHLTHPSNNADNTVTPLAFLQPDTQPPLSAYHTDRHLIRSLFLSVYTETYSPTHSFISLPCAPHDMTSQDMAWQADQIYPRVALCTYIIHCSPHSLQSSPSPSVSQ